MELSTDPNHGEFQINSYQPGKLVINQQPYQQSIILSHNKLITDWPPQTLNDLTAEHCQAIINLKPQVVLLGTGSKLNFPATELLAPLYQQKLGVEVMDTSAACRTYNILISEDRNVVAALLIK